MNGAFQERPSRDTIQAALSFIPPDDREVWLKIGMALKAELGDDGLDLFDTWSQRGESYALDAVQQVWKGFKAGGKIGIGTLLYEAKQRGFNLKDHKPAPPVSAEEAERLQRERQQRNDDEQAEAERLQTLAAESAASAWGKAVTNGESPYLTNKKIAAHGIGFAKAVAGHTVLIPVRDQHGKLWNLQRIFANGDKRFYKGGKVTGCFHTIGDVAVSEWLLVAEGYATAATLHEATGFAVVIAFSAHNLKQVAGIMRECYPDKRMLICADDDSETERTTGKNTGVAAATEAASLVNGVWCKPTGFQYGGNDFNDLMHSSGIDEVKQQIATAMQLPVPIPVTTPALIPTTNEATSNPPQPDQINAQATIATPLILDKASTEKPPAKPRQTNSRKPAGEGQSLKPFFMNHPNGEGVFFHNFHEGEPLPALKICSALAVIAKTRDSANGEWGYLLEFNDPDGHKKRWSMPAKMLSGDGTQYRADLLSMGLMIEPGLKVKNHLTTYIQTADVSNRVRCVDRTGWHGDVYVMPDKTIGDGDEQVLFQTVGGAVSPFKQRGTLKEWQANIGVHCRGNSRMLFFVSTAFASILLHHGNVPSGGFHIWGDSSTGKSTAVIIAGSVFGGVDYKKSWRATDNALEPTAQQYSDALLILDELAQADPKTVGNVVYMLGNEAGKGRATQNATAKRIATWRLLFVSDGEIPLSTHMAEAGKTIKGGHDVRMVHINADAGKGLGVYDTTHDFAGGAALSAHLVKMAQQYYGVAGLTFIEWAVSQSTGLRSILEQEISDYMKVICPKDAHGQVSRVAMRFALVGVAGELATARGITGWSTGEAKEAAITCFNDWLASRGGAGDLEHDRMLSLLPDFIRVHGGARFGWKHREMDDHAPKIINQAGFRRMVSKGGNPIDSNTDHHKEYGDKVHPDESDGATVEYFIDPKVFKDEICKGYDARAVTAKLVAAGVLELGKDGKSSKTFRYAGTTNRYYKVSSEKLGELYA
ncbi:DUF927 domain-containing protein [Undibacterium sp. 5I1]|uniref:DUF927 domain-containing protein n=1 Tax=unclassified Undibacterium TaxID=2630295 RepID=UPI002AB495DC|nr:MULTISPECIES: DUF927 domain-containing protein [unclassified Undibacterium]MDY7537710.1 DUF927 domain-containing protein [Undibacterium sp. 5I1]MEB0230202.1 DUF927 domain-containing protein [Undibacterium sp. 10I3]MEB0256447.1 DUF927 domain-containing protein [Undibacterium sp. 5I1]